MKGKPHSKNLKERLRWMFEHHIKEYAKRLEEIGGPGVGGTELRYSPPTTEKAETREEMKRQALEFSIHLRWEEATWCYVHGHFRACIVLLATLVEAALKLELEKKQIDYDDKTTLGDCIRLCNRSGILSPGTKEIAYQINKRRNDVVHANIERKRPESLLLDLGPEHEIEPIEDTSRNISSDGYFVCDGETIEWSPGKGYSRIYLYKHAAKETLENTEKVLKFLYPRNDHH